MHSCNDFRARWERFVRTIRPCSLIAALLLTNSSTTLFAAVRTTPVAKTDLAAINDSLLDSTVEVEATVKTITKPKEGDKSPVRISLVDDTGSITVVAWPDVFEPLATQTSVAPGDLVHANARVSKYRDEIQLTLRTADDLRVLSKAQVTKPADDTSSPSAADKPVTLLANVNDSLKGKEITVQATVSEVQEPRSERAPFVITLTDGNVKIPMVFWNENDLYTKIKNHIRVGNTIRTKVTVGDYRGTLQLRFRNAQDIQSVAVPLPSAERKDNDRPTESAVSPASRMNIGRITDEWTNRTVTISGTVSTSDSIGKGQRVRVRDASGEIQIILWDNVLAKLPAAELVSGRTITVTGPVKLYRGQLEIVPASPEAVKVASN
jgi:DNA/RNA endonuclease YhcR with UshA esterase domain